ncbi:N-acetylglucosamine kinase [Georgenia faecalis]|uniref:N-acetylglucosamine kinase n=1 Tax=Georgenia faecalis TaxID=2483799 RepID=UPI000FD88EDD|nr:BadF/BadG/BcrA/BcrD ATPase family protein [Georgenia faecalis]
MAGTLAVDLGGSGSRARWTSTAGPQRTATGGGLRVSGAGLVAVPLVTALIDDLGLDAGDVDGACVGLSGLLTLGDGAHAIADAVRERLGAVPTVVASDAVTSSVGALGGEPGAVVLAGTGCTALGTDLADTWHKVDGWGHVLGDAGSGSWIGARGLTAAFEQHDGRRTDAADLLAAARSRFGEPEALTREIYTREDRAGLLASFAADVLDLARDGDAVAGDVVGAAAREQARSLAAALLPPVPPRASYTGGIFGAGEILTVPLAAELARLSPDVVLEAPLGGALDGAELLALRAVAGTLASHPPLLTVVAGPA